MPLYMCNAVKGILSEAAKARIARDITDIHCEVTGASPALVHAFFFEDTPQQALNGKSVFLFGNIREDRTAEQKRLLVERMKEAIHVHAGVAMSGIAVDTADIPASWVMEGGDVIPEPGEEAEWLRAPGGTTA